VTRLSSEIFGGLLGVLRAKPPMYAYGLMLIIGGDRGLKTPLIYDDYNTISLKPGTDWLKILLTYKVLCRPWPMNNIINSC